MKGAIYITSVTVMDPMSKAPVEVEIYRDPISNGMFGIDASFTDQVNYRVVPPMNNGERVLLGDNRKKEPFNTTFIFGDQDSRPAVDRLLRKIKKNTKAVIVSFLSSRNPPSIRKVSFSTADELNAFSSGIEAAEGWLGSRKPDEEGSKRSK